MLNINIPTRGRPEKLEKCLESISCSSYLALYIYCYDLEVDLDLKNERVMNALKHKGNGVNTFIPREDKNILTIESHNRVCKIKGHFLGLSDDIVFHLGAIDAAVRMLEEELDSDGIVDFTVANMDAPDGCFMLLGDKFIEKFPDRTPYCPEYKFMFASAELRDFAKSIGRFRKCPDAKLDHFHPSITGKPDETHNRIRSKGIISDDQRRYSERKKAGKLWSHMQA